VYIQYFAHKVFTVGSSSVQNDSLTKMIRRKLSSCTTISADMKALQKAGLFADIL